VPERFSDPYAEGWQNDPAAQQAAAGSLAAYPWPGKVCEAQDVIDQSVIVCD